MATRVRVRQAHRAHEIRHFKLGEGLPRLADLRDELEDMRQVLLGEVEPPINVGIMTLMEVAEAFFSRACAIEQNIYQGFAEGRLLKNTKSGKAYDEFRARELRSFKEMAKSAADLGSRRITAESLRYQKEMRGRESL